MALSLQQIAKALNGRISNSQVSCAGPNHSAGDNSVSVKLTTDCQDIIVNTFSPADDRLAVLDWAREKIGIHKRNGNGRADIDQAKLMQEAIATQHESKFTVTETYPYEDRDATLLYQVLRLEPKSFRQRRPDGKGGWIWNLNDVRRVPYRWPELIEYPDATAAFCEGEKDANTVAALGWCATTIASSKWTDEIVQALAGRHVWIFPDADAAGDKRALEAAQHLHSVAASIKLIWLPGLTGEKHRKDVSDWLNIMSHTADELYEVCASTPDWEPSAETKSKPDQQSDDSRPLPNSKSLVAFPLVRFGDVSVSSEKDYLIKGLIPRVGLVLVWGPPKCGKSFWGMDIALHIALGWPYRERKTQQASVVYLALEGHGGYARRIEAFRRHHSVTDAPFYLLRSKINLVRKVDQLIKDVEAQLANERPGAVFIDTLNRSLSGSESSDEDMAKYLEASGKIEQHFGCCVVVIHHCGLDATRPRGHTSLTAAVDMQIAIKRGHDLQVIATVDFAKDDAEGAELYSQLHPVEVGFDTDGDPINSLVLLPANKGTIRKPVATRLNARQINALAALDEATLNAGIEPAFEVHSAIRRVTTLEAWNAAMLKNGTIKKNDANPWQTLGRIQDQLAARRAIGVHHQFVWRACG